MKKGAEMQRAEAGLQQNKARISILCLLLYFVFAIPMYFYIDGAIEIGSFGFMYHYLYGFGIIALAFFAMLFSERNHVTASLLKSGTVLSLSYIIPVLLSCFIWGFLFEKTEHIITGLFLNVYIILAIMVGIGTVFFFGVYAPLISCIAMGAANLIIITQVFVQDPGEFISEMRALIFTFGEDTGPLMKSVEIHDLTFAFGLYLLYAIINKDLKGRKIIFLISLFFSLTGLKRIAFIGIVLGTAVWFLCRNLKEKAAKNAGIVTCIIVILFSIVWIVTIHAGLLDVLETRFHVDTKGRQLIFRQLNRLFYVSPFFMGKGIGWSKHAWDTLSGRHVILDAFHDEYVRMYIENGFMGYLVWIFTNTILRFLYFFRTDGKKSGMIFISLMLYLYATYSSDNTYYYYYTSMALFVEMLTEDAVRLQTGEKYARRTGTAAVLETQNI